MLLRQDPKYVNGSGIKIRKVNGTRGIVGKGIIHIPITKNDILRISSYKKQGGEYRMLPYKLERKFCHYDPIVNPEMKRLSAASTVPFPPKCPIPNVSFTQTIN